MDSARVVESPWLSAKEVAEYVGRNTRTSYKTFLLLARTGKIKAGHDGKTYLFRKEDVDAWLYLNAKKGGRRVNQIAA